MLCHDAGSELNQRYRPQAAADNDLVFEALAHVHARACATASEIRALLVGGYPAGADARWRTLHELAVVALLLNEHGPDLAERYLLHEHVDVLRNARVYQEVCGTLQKLSGSEYDPIPEPEFREMEQTANELVARYGTKYRTEWDWAAALVGGGQAPAFGDLEKRAGLNHLRSFYRLGNLSTHASSKGTAMHVVQRGPTRVLRSGPINAGLSGAGQGAMISLNQVTAAFLAHGVRKTADPMLIATVLTIAVFAKEGCQRFADIEDRLEAEEAAIWSEDEPEDST